MKTPRVVGPVPPVKASAVCIGGQLDGKVYLVPISYGHAFEPTDDEWKEHGKDYRCEYLSIDRFTYHVIIHHDLSVVAAIGRLLDRYGNRL